MGVLLTVGVLPPGDAVETLWVNWATTVCAAAVPIRSGPFGGVEPDLGILHATNMNASKIARTGNRNRKLKLRMIHLPKN
jgi:hypothetical protein